jgi:hypothetical protein
MRNLNLLMILASYLLVQEFLLASWQTSFHARLPPANPAAFAIRHAPDGSESRGAQTPPALAGFRTACPLRSFPRLPAAI